ncbi:MAG: ATP synthase F1 subunit gamma [Bacteroidales bacterium]|nr:ATP synthase F1 subunit gamma [Bacteroidales bacterium]MBD5222813.1 ATP synthase F1 subunit gamma [Bacteroidales bacterium]MBD5302203.1 ATP synthase F1 subunit gamma [Bacteroides sp.]MBD5348964.1 ATP synthase F1 subunit gamma [Bacteroides sp.]
MATLRELKTRIGSVASTEKITGAMKMISSAKVHQNEQALRQLQPFKEKIKSIMGHILATDVTFDSPLIRKREVKKAAVVVFGSDDGLCGAYNVNIFKGFLVSIDRLRNRYGADLKVDVYPVGKKMEKAVRRLHDGGLNIITIDGVDSKMKGDKVNSFTHSLRDAFINGDVDCVEVIYMKYISMSRQKLTEEILFPVSEDALAAETETGNENQLYIFEPDPNSIFNQVLPMFVLSTMQQITIENRSSEQAARVMAMQSANDNAKKLNEELQLEYNKLRQQGITTELLDILGGQVER